MGAGSANRTLREGDSVEITSDETLLNVKIAFADNPSFSDLMQKVPRAVLPAPLLMAKDRRLLISRQDKPDIEIQLGGQSTWPELRRLLQVEGLSARLVPEDPIWLRPGDEIVLTRMYQDKPSGPGGGAKPSRFYSDEYHLTVDGNGDIWIPPISTAGMGITQPGIKDEMIGHMDRAAFRVHLWRPDQKYSEIPSLSALANCLTMAQAAGPTNPPPVCKYFGIDARFSPSTQDFQVIRYQIQGAPGTWTIVDEDDHRSTQRISRSETVHSAVVSAYRRLAHADLIRRQLGKQRAYLTVLPADEWGSPRERTPFWCEINQENPAPFAQVLLLPGDTIFVSRERPHLSTRKTMSPHSP
jgi:hypothetical protein